LERAYRDRDIARTKGVTAAGDMTKLTWSGAARQFHGLAEQLATR